MLQIIKSPFVWLYAVASHIAWMGWMLAACSILLNWSLLTGKLIIPGMDYVVTDAVSAMVGEKN
jgi:hypothetical protein